jgi:hypothetical protein
MKNLQTLQHDTILDEFEQWQDVTDFLYEHYEADYDDFEEYVESMIQSKDAKTE